MANLSKSVMELCRDTGGNTMAFGVRLAEASLAMYRGEEAPYDRDELHLADAIDFHHDRAAAIAELLDLAVDAMKNVGIQEDTIPRAVRMLAEEMEAARLLTRAMTRLYKKQPDELQAVSDAA